jgi:hypothetical protein
MIVTRREPPQQFMPVTIILESQDEVNHIYNILNINAEMLNKVYAKANSIPLSTTGSIWNFNYEMWQKFNNAIH